MNKNNNIFSRAVKLYLKAAANPISAGIALFLMIGMFVCFIVMPEQVGSEGYMSMIGAIQVADVGGFIFIMFGNLKLHQNKYYSASICAKTLFTSVPIFTGLMIGLIYDVILAAAAGVNLGSAGLADVLVFDSVSTACVVLFAACCGKKKLSIVSEVPFLLVTWAFPIILDGSCSANGILGLPLGAAFAIAVSIYAVSAALALVIANIWWKNGDRFAMPNKAVL